MNFTSLAIIKHLLLTILNLKGCKDEGKKITPKFYGKEIIITVHI